MSCAICLEEIDGVEKSIRLPCNHVFHEQCFDILKRKRLSLEAIPCPLCRKPILSTERRFVILDREKLKNQPKKTNKVSNLLKIILCTFTLIIMNFYIIANPSVIGEKSLYHYVMIMITILINILEVYVQNKHS
jgi:hypothetical protein